MNETFDSPLAPLEPFSIRCICCWTRCSSACLRLKSAATMMKQTYSFYIAVSSLSALLNWRLRVDGWFLRRFQQIEESLVVSVLHSRLSCHLTFQLLAEHLSLRYYKRGKLVSAEPLRLERLMEKAADVPSYEESCETCARASSEIQLE